MDRASLPRGRLSPGVLPALPRLPAVLPAAGAGPLPQAAAQQYAAGRIRLLSAMTRPGFVVGLAAEARIAARSGFPVRAGGGTPSGATEAASGLVCDGATA